MRAAWTIAVKDLKQRLRDRSAIIVGIIAPLVLAAIFSFVFNPIEDFEFSATYVVVDQDGGPAARLFVDQVKPDGLVLIDEDLVTPPVKSRHRILGVPATRIAEDLGKRIVANMVMVGFFAASTNLLEVDSVREAIRTSVPVGTEDANLAAFDAGFDFGRGAVAHTSGEEVTA